MKIVGILLRCDETYHLNKELAKWLLKNKIIPIGIVNDDLDSMIQVSKLCDGIILQGGSNYNDNELLFIKYLYKNNIPTLGICLGMQMMSVLFDGILETVSGHKSEYKYVHKVYLEKNSKLYEIVNKDEINVNSRHNDYVKHTNLKISAISEDGIIEAVEDSSKKFFIGVQWHPESLQDETSNRILKYYISSL